MVNLYCFRTREWPFQGKPKEETLDHSILLLTASQRGPTVQPFVGMGGY